MRALYRADRLYTDPGRAEYAGGIAELIFDDGRAHVGVKNEFAHLFHARRIQLRDVRKSAAEHDDVRIEDADQTAEGPAEILKK